MHDVQNIKTVIHTYIYIYICVCVCVCALGTLFIQSTECTRINE